MNKSKYYANKAIGTTIKINYNLTAYNCKNLTRYVKITFNKINSCHLTLTFLFVNAQFCSNTFIVLRELINDVLLILK